MCRQTDLLYVLQIMTDKYTNMSKQRPRTDRQIYTHPDLTLFRGSSHENHNEQMNNIKPTESTDDWRKKALKTSPLSPFASLPNRSSISVTCDTLPASGVI